MRNEIEEKTWKSIDVFMDEICDVAYKAIKQGVSPEYIAEYIHAETKTITRGLRTGKMREFDTIYNEFIDEVVENGRYDEWLDFLKFRRGLSDVRLP